MVTLSNGPTGRAYSGHAIIHQTQMSDSEKMTHLQQSVAGKAKSAEAGFATMGISTIKSWSVSKVGSENRSSSPSPPSSFQ